MAEVREGKRTAAALLWSRRGGRHYELLWPPGEEEAEAVAEADEEEGTESKGDAEVTMEEELAEEGPEKGGRKEIGRRSKCGRMYIKYRSRRGVRGGGTRDKRVPGRRGGDWGGVQRETGNYGQDAKVC